jgi:hypothetical protein
VREFVDKFAWVLVGVALGLVAWWFRHKYIGALGKLLYQLGALGRSRRRVCPAEAATTSSEA